ncbi:MAG: hypothetical protein JWO31_1007 [Phycisphaerales bacterium]|nr:hypothetical protein [Phycisphaerales bacterium]
MPGSSRQLPPRLRAVRPSAGTPSAGRALSGRAFPARAGGTILIYSVFAMVAMIGVASLAVDLGRAQLAKTEMECAVDAAGRAATAYLPSDTAGARSAAIAIAAAHTVAGQSLVLQSGDVVFGKWNSATKVLDTTSATPDAARVTAVRTAARGTPVPMTLAKSIGFTSLDLSFSATVVGNTGTLAYGILGLNSLSISAASTGTYDSTAGTFATGASSADGDVASNGTITLGTGASVGGTIYYKNNPAPSGGSYYAARTKMSTAAATPATPSAGAYAASNANAGIGYPTTGANVYFTTAGTSYAPGGTYVFDSVNVSGATIQFTGPAVIYMNGSVSLSSAQMLAYQNKPANLQIKFCTASSLNVSASTLYAVVTAPTATVNMSGTSCLAGSVVASGISASGGTIYYDAQLGPNGQAAAAGSTVVK